MSAHRGRPGRPSKGERLVVSARIPVELRRAIDEEAEAEGVSINDFIEAVLMKHVTLRRYKTGAPLQKTA